MARHTAASKLQVVKYVDTTNTPKKSVDVQKTELVQEKTNIKPTNTRTGDPGKAKVFK